MKRLFSALAVGTLVFGAVLASAANLPVNGGTIQVGTDSTLACDTDGVVVSYNTNYLGVVTSVNVEGVNDAACAGQHLYVYGLNAGGHIIGAPHAPSVECGAPGTMLAVTNPLITLGTTTYKIALLSVNPADDDLNAATYPCGVDGGAIEGVRVMIGV